MQTKNSTNTYIFIGILLIILSLIYLPQSFSGLNPQSDNLLAYYDMDDATEEMADSSGNGLDTTAYGNMNAVEQQQTGKDGYSQSFGYENSAGYYSVSNPSSLNGLSQLSINLWFYQDTIIGSPYQYFVSKDSTSRGFYFRKDIQGNLGFYTNGIGDNSGLLVYDNTSILPPNTEWAMLTATYDGEYKRIYKNGVLLIEEEATGTLPSNTADLTFRKRYSGDSGVYLLFGKLDEISIWDKGLTQSEIASLYATGSPSSDDGCSDGIKNNDEIFVDCSDIGGTCSSCVSLYGSNGEHDEDFGEDEIDCRYDEFYGYNLCFAENTEIGAESSTSPPHSNLITGSAISGLREVNSGLMSFLGWLISLVKGLLGVN
jgi:hypothetical protein